MIPPGLVTRFASESACIWSASEPKKERQIKAIIRKTPKLQSIALISLHVCTLLLQDAEVIFHQFNGSHIISFLRQRHTVTAGAGADVDDTERLCMPISRTPGFQLLRFPVSLTFPLQQLQITVNIEHRCVVLHLPMSALQPFFLIKFIIVGNQICHPFSLARPNKYP